MEVFYRQFSIHVLSEIYLILVFLLCLLNMVKCGTNCKTGNLYTRNSTESKGHRVDMA